MGQYNIYDFNSDTSFIPRKCCHIDMEVIKHTIEETVDKSIDEKQINVVIEKAINDNIDEDRLKETIETTIEENLDKINFKEDVEAIVTDNTNKLSKQIEESKEEIISEIGNIDMPCLCNLATKKDVEDAVNKVNEHTDNKFNEINFEEQFENLNNQIKNLKV